MIAHVVPRDDLITHDVPKTNTGDHGSCVCGPALRFWNGATGDYWLYIHHSLDGREKTERRGDTDGTRRSAPDR